MAKGGTGLMGEAGPEAVMPLKRGKDGKLGVAGGGGINISNNIVIENGGQMADDPEKMNRFAAKIGEEIRNQVRSVIMDEQRVNGVLNSAAMRRYA
jgi:phage-related minor tail protein